MAGKMETVENMFLSRTERDGLEVFEFHSAANLYLSGEQALTYLDAVLTSAYQSRLAEPLRHLLDSRVAYLITVVDRPTAFIDLGPGVPLNSQSIINYLKNGEQAFCYVPVDISKSFLTITSCFFADEPFKMIPLNMLFEDLSNYIDSSSPFPYSYRRVINMGLTFNNFTLNEICNILKSLFRKGDQIIAASEIYDALCEEASFAPYRTEAAKRFNFLPLNRLGFSRDHLKYFVRIHEGRIEMGFSIEESKTLKSGETIPSGAEIITSVSYRYTEEELVDRLQKFFSSVEICRNRNERVCLIIME